MAKLILWGANREYEYYRKRFEVELLKGTISISAIVLNEGILFREIDGIPLIKIEDIVWAEYDYLVDMNMNSREQADRILELLQIPKEKVIPARVMALPFFDFARWEQVKRNKVSIIASHCWGGLVYNTLGLPFLSPFINMAVYPDDFLRLCANLTEYMKQPLTHVKDWHEYNLQRNYPIMKLGDVQMHFNHYSNAEEAILAWEKRKERINYDNILIEMVADTEQQLEGFLRLPYEHKVCYTMLPCWEKNVISIQSDYHRQLYNGNIVDFANRTATRDYVESKVCDLLKLLNHEEDYLRIR